MTITGFAIPDRLGRAARKFSTGLRAFRRDWIGAPCRKLDSCIRATKHRGYFRISMAITMDERRCSQWELIRVCNWFSLATSAPTSAVGREGPRNWRVSRDPGVTRRP